MKTILISVMILSFLYFAKAQELPVKIIAHFDSTLQLWDGFGVNYVETRHTRNYIEFEQDYGGMKYLDETEKNKLIDLVFGEDGLQPDIIKCFLDPFHELQNDNNDPCLMNESIFNHEQTTRQMRFFLDEGLKITRKRDEDLVVFAGIYGPPWWMNMQKSFRGRDLNPELIPELAEYLAAWAKYLQNTYKANVRYISMHNEGESYNRWSKSGIDDPFHYGHDYNLFWTDDNVVDFIVSARKILDCHGLQHVGITTGEPAVWSRLFEYTPNDHIQLKYAERIANNPIAISSIGLITSHGFDYGGNQFDPRAVELLQKTRPELHSWTTSCTWGEMNLEIVEQARGYIYETGNNGIIPWATVHNNLESDKLNPPRGFRISSNANSPIQTNNGILETTKAYYYFKQMSRAGRAGMKVAKVSVSGNKKVSALAWSTNGTKYPDALVIINHEFEPINVNVSLFGTKADNLRAYLTQDFGDMNYSAYNNFKFENSVIIISLPERSVITFFTK